MVGKESKIVVKNLQLKGRQRNEKACKKNRTKGKSTAWSFGRKNIPNKPFSLIGLAYTRSLTWGEIHWTPRTAWGKEQGYKKKNLKGVGPLLWG